MNDKFKLLIFYVDRLHHTDRWFFFIVELWGKKIIECSIDLIAINSAKINFFIDKLVSPETDTHKMNFYFNALAKLVNETPNISSQFFPLKYLDERGYFNCPSRYFMNNYETFSEPKRQLEFTDSTFIKPYRYRRQMELFQSEMEKSKPVLEWHRFKAYRWHDIGSDACAKIEAYCILGDMGEKVYVHLSLNSERQILKIVFLKNKSTDDEIGTLIMAHFRKAFINERYIFAKEFKGN